MRIRNIRSNYAFDARRMCMKVTLDSNNYDDVSPVATAPVATATGVVHWCNDCGSYQPVKKNGAVTRCPHKNVCHPVA